MNNNLKEPLLIKPPGHNNNNNKNENPETWPLLLSPKQNYLKHRFSTPYLVFLLLLPYYLLIITADNNNKTAPKFHLNSMSVSLMDPSVPGSWSPVSWNVSLSLNNPNGFLDIMYDGFAVWLFYGRDVKVSVCDNIVVRPFYQGPKGKRVVKEESYCEPGYLENRAVLEKIGRDWTRNRVTVFHVLMTGTVSIISHSGLEKRALLKVRCTDLPVKFSANSTAGTWRRGGGVRPCRISLV